MLDRYRHLIFGLLTLITLGGLGGYYYLSRPVNSPIEIVKVTPSPVMTATPQPTPSPTPSPLRVYVTGAVITPDVYILPPGSIVKDVIKVAGGLTTDADWVQFNQALEVQDQQHIHIPRLGEKNAPPPVQNGHKPMNEAVSTKNELINLNTASLEQLDSLPKIGPVIAQRIIDYREKHGDFKSIEELTEVSGIGEDTIAKIKDLVTVQP